MKGENINEKIVSSLFILRATQAACDIRATFSLVWQAEAMLLPTFISTCQQPLARASFEAKALHCHHLMIVITRAILPFERASHVGSGRSLARWQVGAWRKVEIVCQAVTGLDRRKMPHSLGLREFRPELHRILATLFQLRRYEQSLPAAEAHDDWFAAVVAVAVVGDCWEISVPGRW
jgi:hypothetical protein